MRGVIGVDSARSPVRHHQTRSKIDNRADHAVLRALLVANRSDKDVPGGDADAARQTEAFRKGSLESESGEGASCGVVLVRVRGNPETHHEHQPFVVHGELFDEAFVVRHVQLQQLCRFLELRQIAGALVLVVRLAHRGIRVEENHRDVAQLRGRDRASLKDPLHLKRNVQAEQLLLSLSMGDGGHLFACLPSDIPNKQFLQDVFVNGGNPLFTAAARPRPRPCAEDELEHTVPERLGRDVDVWHEREPTPRLLGAHEAARLSQIDPSRELRERFARGYVQPVARFPTHEKGGHRSRGERRVQP
mmetsp:Transcript_18748/g.61213  ORF Transcript_18748/g.61213 Transcript_18748/m.61213 type:complete len:304 (-) Transcript_18748:1050-1961(-)